MRQMDHELARQLITTRHEIYKLKLQKSCNEHDEMLENLQEDIEELGEMAEITDLPISPHNPGLPLKQFGVTKMNLYTRRFSCC